MWNLVFWEVAYTLSEPNFRCWSETSWGLFLYHTHHGLKMLSFVIHWPFRWGLGSKTVQSIRSLLWTKRQLDRGFSQCSFVPSSFRQCFMLAHSLSPTFCNLSERMPLNTTRERMSLKIISTCDIGGRLKVNAILMVIMLTQSHFYL